MNRIVIHPHDFREPAGKVIDRPLMTEQAWSLDHKVVQGYEGIIETGSPLEGAGRAWKELFPGGSKVVNTSVIIQ